MKKVVFSVIAVFIVWTVLDFVVHWVILLPAYNATSSLWRPMREMKMPLLHLSVLISVVAFVCIYSQFFSRKGVATGLKYGLWYGLGTGVSMGYGSYAVMPIPYHMALVWFLGTLVEATLGGLIVGSIIGE